MPAAAGWVKGASARCGGEGAGGVQPQGKDMEWPRCPESVTAKKDTMHVNEKCQVLLQPILEGSIHCTWGRSFGKISKTRGTKEELHPKAAFLRDMVSELNVLRFLAAVPMRLTPNMLYIGSSSTHVCPCLSTSDFRLAVHLARAVDQLAHTRIDLVVVGDVHWVFKSKLLAVLNHIGAPVVFLFHVQKGWYKPSTKVW